MRKQKECKNNIMYKFSKGRNYADRCPTSRNGGELKYLLYILFCFFLNVNYLYGQVNGQFSLIGSASNEQKEMVQGGNAIILSVKDSSVIKGVFFMDGNYRIDGLTDNKFYLKIVAIGYMDTIQTIVRKGNDSILNIGNIVLRTEGLLNTVNVVAKVRPFIANEEGVLVNVQGTGLSDLGTALDILKKSPGVIVSPTDDVNVFGKGTAIIYVDGQIIASNDILKSISSSDIKSIEVITNPSAKYDAGGRAVINIITRKSNLQGYNASIIQNILYGKYYSTYTGIPININTGKWQFNFKYGVEEGQTWSSDDYYRNFSSNSNAINMYNNIYTIRKNSNVQRCRAGVSYNIDSLSSIAIQYRGSYNGYNDNIQNSDNIYENGIGSNSIQTSTNATPIIIDNSLVLNYAKRFDSAGTELSVTAQYSDYSNKNSGQISQQIIYPDSVSLSNKRSNNIYEIKIATGQIDFKKIFSKNVKLEIGAKNTLTSISSVNSFDNYYADGWVADPEFSNQFTYNEDILGGYCQLSYRKNKFSIRAGVRSESTVAQGYEGSSNQEIINQQYVNLFPSAYVGYDFTQDMTIGITYSNRIDRPKYQDLYPYINYIDSLSYFIGNPYLSPAHVNYLEASIIYMQEASLTFGLSRADNDMMLITNKLNAASDAFYATTENIKYNETYSVGMTLPYELGPWSTSNSIGYAFNTFSYVSNNTTIQNSSPGFYAHLYNSITVGNLFVLEITYEYNSQNVNGMFITNPWSNFSVDIRRTFLKNKLSVGFYANDIFQKEVLAGNSNVPYYNVNYVSMTNTHNFILHLSYSFGKLKNQDYKEKNINKEEYDRIKKS